MKNLHFVSIVAEGFKTFTSRQEVTIGGDGSLLGLMCGHNKANPKMGGNAVGKSTIIDALVWGLYGATVRGVKAGGVKGWLSKKNDVCLCEVHFTLDDVPCCIKRTWGPNSLELMQGDGEYRTVAQDVIDDLIGLSYTEFCSTVCLGQFSELFLDYKPTQRAMVFSSILPLDVWGEYSTVASKKVSDIVRDLDSIQHDIDNDEQYIDTFSISKLESDCEEWERDIASSRNKARKKIKASRLRIKKMRRNIEIIETEKLPPSKKKLKKNLVILEQLELRKEAVSKDVLHINKVIAKLKGKRDEIISQLNRLDKIDGKCPVCLSTVKDGHKERHVQLMNSKISKVELEIDNATIRQADIDVAYIDIGNDIKNIKNSIEILDDAVDKLKSKVKELKADVEYEKEDILKLKEEYNYIGSTKNPYLDTIKTLKDKKNSIASKIKVSKKRKNTLNKKLVYYKYWVKGFKDIRLFLINEVLLHLEVEVNNVLSDFGMEEWKMNFAADKVTASGNISKGFTVNIYPPGATKPIQWEAWSGGETQRLRLAAQLGLSNLILGRKGINVNIQVFDEPTTYLSGIGIEDLMYILQQWAKDNDRWVWIIDHRTLDFRFDKVLKIIKTTKGSKIKEKVAM